MPPTLGEPPAGEGWAFEMKWAYRRGRRRPRRRPRWKDRGARREGAAIVQSAAAADARRAPDCAAAQRLPGHLLRLRRHRARRRIHHRPDIPRIAPATRRPEAGGQAGAGAQVPRFWTGVDGDRMLDLAREHRLEGVVAKKVDSTYRMNHRISPLRVHSGPSTRAPAFRLLRPGSSGHACSVVARIGPVHLQKRTCGSSD